MISLIKLFFVGLLSGTFLAFSANAQDEKAKKEDAPIGKGIDALPKDIVKKIDESKPGDLSQKLNLAINMLGREGQLLMKTQFRLNVISRKVAIVENEAKNNKNIAKVRDLVTNSGFKSKVLGLLDKADFEKEFGKILEENSLTPRDVVDYNNVNKMVKVKADLSLAQAKISEEFNKENPSISGIPLSNDGGDNFGKELENILAMLSSRPTQPSRPAAVNSNEMLKNALKELIGAGN